MLEAVTVRNERLFQTDVLLKDGFMRVQASIRDVDLVDARKAENHIKNVYLLMCVEWNNLYDKTITFAKNEDGNYFFEYL